LVFDGCVGPNGHGSAWSTSQRSAGLSQPGQRHVKSRHLMKSAFFALGRYPGSGAAPVGTITG
jgi:hypothetical protein